MHEITIKEETLWTEVRGRVIDMRDVDTQQYGVQKLITLMTPDGSLKSIYRTPSMRGLNEAYVGQMVHLTRETLTDGSSLVHVFVDEVLTPPAPSSDTVEALDSGYDPFQS